MASPVLTLSALNASPTSLNCFRKVAGPTPLSFVNGITSTISFSCLIETDYNFGSQSAYYVNLETNLDQTRLYLGVYGSMKVTDFNQGTVFEIVP
jgi:hypothetical protein